MSIRGRLIARLTGTSLLLAFRIGKHVGQNREDIIDWNIFQNADKWFLKTSGGIELSDQVTNKAVIFNAGDHQNSVGPFIRKKLCLAGNEAIFVSTNGLSSGWRLC